MVNLKPLRFALLPIVTTPPTALRNLPVYTLADQPSTPAYITLLRMSTTIVQEGNDVSVLGVADLRHYIRPFCIIVTSVLHYRHSQNSTSYRPQQVRIVQIGSGCNAEKQRFCTLQIRSIYRSSLSFLKRANLLQVVISSTRFTHDAMDGRHLSVTCRPLSVRS